MVDMRKELVRWCWWIWGRSWSDGGYEAGVGEMGGYEAGVGWMVDIRQELVRWWILGRSWSDGGYTVRQELVGWRIWGRSWSDGWI